MERMIKMADMEQKTLVEVNNSVQEPNTETTQFDIKSMIYVVRNQQVMIDSDLAMLYQVETKRLNEAVKRNIARFPEEFRFQLTAEETESLRSQFATLNENDGRGKHRKYLPYVFTEQGIAMLSAVLRSDVAIQVSISIMKSFVEMRRFIANNALLFERISTVELRQLEYQKQTDEKLEQIFEYISEHEESSQKVFFDGQIYDAFSLIVNLIQKAEIEITLIDGYVDVGTLNLLSKKKSDVAVTIYTQKQTKLTKADVKNFNAQYPTLKIKYTKVFHDRFLILDQATAYHVGASLKDAGKKCFGINLIQDAGIIKDILQRLELEAEE
ncbi:MAG: ORF6N domain-containing protein [Finegoldia sp.]